MGTEMQELAKRENGVTVPTEGKTKPKRGGQAYLHADIFLNALDTPTQSIKFEAYINVFFRAPDLESNVVHNDDGSLLIPDEPNVLPLGPKKPVQCDVVEEIDPPEYKFDTETKVGRLTYHVRAESTHAFQLRNFPFDRQLVRIGIPARRTGMGSLKKSDREEWGGWEWLSKRPNWVEESKKTYKEMNFNRVVTVRMAPVVETEYKQSAPLVNFATPSGQHAAIYLRFERRDGYYISHIIMPVCIFFMSHLSCYIVPFEDLADRLSVTLTLMLTTAACQYVVSDHLPITSQFTALDKYVLLAYVLLAVTVAENCVVAGLNFEPSTIQGIDLGFALTLVVVWLVATLRIIILAVGGSQLSWKSIHEFEQKRVELRYVLSNEDGVVPYKKDKTKRKPMFDQPGFSDHLREDDNKDLGKMYTKIQKMKTKRNLLGEQL